MSKIEEFQKFRERMNETILEKGNLGIRRFFALDTKCYEPGVLSAKVKELSAEFRIAGLLQRGRNEGSIAAPHVGIRVAAKPYDVRIIGSDDGSPIVDLRSQDEQAAVENISNSR